MFPYRKYILLCELQFQHVYVPKLGVKIQPVARECQGHDSSLVLPHDQLAPKITLPFSALL